MTCAAGNPNFFLLDSTAGWDVDPNATQGLVGTNPPGCLALAPPTPPAPGQQVTEVVDLNQVVPYLPPAALARGCGACEWYLVTPAPPTSLLLHRDACHTDWQQVWKRQVVSPLQGAVAVAVGRGRIAISEQGANRVRVWAEHVWAEDGMRQLADIAIAAPGPLTFNQRGELFVTSANSPLIARYDAGGRSRGSFAAPLPSGSVFAIAVDSNDCVWVVTQQNGSWTLWSAAPGYKFVPATISQLQNAFAPTGLVNASPEGFCFNQDTRRGLGTTTCFNWYGSLLQAAAVGSYPLPPLSQYGQLMTQEIDSGVPRCQWHRIRVDADVPPGTTFHIAVATTEEINPPAQGDQTRELPPWNTFPPAVPGGPNPAGVPHFSDWTMGPSGSTDFLIDQPPGRYLYLRLRMIGNGTATPMVRSIQIDFPRVTSLDHLPEVYRENPNAEDFSERFLSLFDASIADLDRTIERYPALLDAGGVPEQLLPWLGGFFDITFDPTWDATLRRSILQNAPQLYLQRGTAAGLQLAVQTVFGVSIAINEFSAAGPWGALLCKPSSAQKCCAESSSTASSTASVSPAVCLGSTRLFGRNSSRFRLDHSTLGVAPLRGYGNPDRDPFASGAYRFQVLVPASAALSQSQQQQRFSNLVQAQSPAHTIASIRFGGTGFIVGLWSAVGIDSAFLSTPAPVLGSGGTAQLNRMSILPGPTGTQSSIGRNTIIGTQFIAG
jgi:phage tail-like protein